MHVLTHTQCTRMDTYTLHTSTHLVTITIVYYRDLDTTKVKIQLWDTAGQERYCILLLLVFTLLV